MKRRVREEVIFELVEVVAHDVSSDQIDDDGVAGIDEATCSTR